MNPSEDSRPAPRPSYLGVGITYPERDEPQEIDDIRTNLSEQFLLLEDTIFDSARTSSVDAKEPMQVYLRVRPFTGPEVEQKESQDCVSIPDPCSVLVKAPLSSQSSRQSDRGSSSVAQKFTFTHVFGPETTQSQFFEGTVKKQVIDFMKGQNRLIFTYGVTNAGKTFTFQGTKDDAGILPRSMEMLFNAIEGKVYSQMDIKPHRCRDYIRLTKEQVRAENTFKNGVLRHTKEADPQCSIRSSNSRTSADTTDFLNDDAGGFPNSSRVLSEFEERVRKSDDFKLDADGSTKFSVWISFCEIYNECIYDLLDPISGDKCFKRKTLKLAQDVKGFSFVKDLQWVQVSDAKEACRILTLGKKFQSIAFTKLNSSSSRSHSIFTVRLLKIEDADVPRVAKVSELTLCDLAGSERCTKTQNEGERLKESGNINTSLLILGKCINALKNSQQSKMQQHVPFRESKLTHYLQSFFTGKGKVCMIVNISQVASAYDETVNVLKFSAVAQKVLILDSCQSADNLSHGQRKSAREVSFLINNADNKRWLSRKRATVQWENRLDDVVEDAGDEDYDEHCDDEDPLDCTNLDDQEEEEEEVEVDEDEIVIKKEAYEKLLELVEDLKTKLVNEKKDKLLMELKIREEIAKEFTEHFMQREHDFSERLQKEKELLEERCDERMEIFQDLVRKCSNEEEDIEEEGPKEQCSVTAPAVQADELNIPLQGLFSSMQSDLAVIKKQAVEAHHHIAAIHDDPEEMAVLEERLKQVTSDLSETQEELKRKSADLESKINQLEESDKTLLALKQQSDQLMDMIQQKDTAIEKLKDLISHWEAKCEDYEKTLNTIRGEMGKVGSDASRKRPPGDHHSPEEQPPSKKDFIDPNDSQMKSDEKHKDVWQNRDESAVLRELEDVKAEKENYKVQTVKLAQSVAELEGKLAGYEEKLNDLKSKNKSLVSELQMQKDLVLSMEGTINVLKQEVDQNQLNIANKVAQIKTIQSKLDDFGKTDRSQDSAGVDFFNLTDIMEESSKGNRGQIESQVGKMASGRESAFYNAIEGLWKKCQDVLRESSQKNKQLLQFEKQLDDLKREMAVLQNSKESEMSSQGSILKEKDELIVQLKEQLLEASKHLESLKKQEFDYKNQLSSNSQRIMDLGLLVDSYKEKSEKPSSLEEQCKKKSVAIETLEKRLAELQAEHMDCEKNQKKLNEEKNELEQKIRGVQEELTAAETAKNEREKQVKESMGDTEVLKKDLLQKDNQLKTVQLDLQRKEEDFIELKEKLADAKKQMQQVEKEISAMREEKKALTSKMNEYEKSKKQMSCELELKQRTIQQLTKEQRDEKTENTMQLYQKACEDVKVKERIIEDMKLTLIEQEQTQEEQEQALEAKTEEAEKLAEELELWKQKYTEKTSGKENVMELSRETNNNTETSKTEVIKLQTQLKELEEKFNNDKKKWFEDKKTLIAQAKESENQRNREMRKFADDRERYGKQQAEMEQLHAQLAEKDDTLQKWREEQSSIVSEIEVQLKSLLSSIAEKEKEIEILKSSKREETLTPPESSAVEELKRQLASSEATIKEYQDKLTKLENAQASTSTAAEKENIGIEKTVTKTQSETPLPRQEKKSSTSCTEDLASETKSQDGSDVVLDSSMISTENGKTSRFPKPQMEISFSPVKPNKMEVKHHGDDSPVTVKISRPTRKRKSTDMEQDVVKNENKKNTRSNKMTPSSLASPATSIYSSKRQTLKKQPSSSSTASTQKKDGTLQKLGEFLQSSPSIFQTKAKKFLETIGAPKSTDLNSGRNADENKPKKSRRKLYSTEISAPLDIPAHAIIMDTIGKESDHHIMKRRLRTRTGK